VSGTTEWSTYEIPFRLEKGERPERVKLNVAIEGKGTVWIKDITLNKFPLPPFKERPPMARGTDQELIQGTWKPVRADVNGMPAPEAMFKTLNPHIAIMGAQVVWKLGPNTLPNFEGEITLDPSKSPKAINMIVFDKANRERKVLLGIYKLEGDTLEICSALNPDAPADRPREFKSVAKGFVGHIVLQRAKSGANPRDPAFQPLFNGKNLDGWVAYADKKGADAKSAWEINGKLLFCRGEPSSYLRTVKSYKNYVLQMDFRYPRPSGPKAHNGVLLHLNGPDEVWPNCIQVQLDGKDTGSVFPMPGAKSTVLKVQDKARLRGEWNQLTIASRDGTVEVQMNGESLGSVTGCEPSAGHIGLQVKGSEIHFRDVRIRELPNSPESTFQPLFNGKDLDGWDGDKAIWKFQNDLLIGTPPPGGVVDNTFLVSKKRYKDFELKFQVRLKDGAGNSGVQVRSETIPGDPPFRMRGPQADIADGYWGSLWGEHVPEQSGHMFKQAPPDLVNRVLKFNDFNDYYVKCVGKRVTIKVNGLTTVDEEFAAISDAGLLGWQMHFGKLAPKEVLFRAIQIRELTPSKERND
jgi:uncharacterized protein (TIGR03067 family)